MDATGLERIQVAELKLLHALKETREDVAKNLYAAGDAAAWFESLGMHLCLLLCVDPSGARPSPWDEDVFGLLYDFLGEGHVAW